MVIVIGDTNITYSTMVGFTLLISSTAFAVSSFDIINGSTVGFVRLIWRNWTKVV